QTEGVELRGKRLGVVGAGPIGARMVELGKAIGMGVVAWTRHASPEREAELGCRLVPLEELFRSSDVVSIHLAATTETDGLVTATLLEPLSPAALVVNTPP